MEVSVSPLIAVLTLKGAPPEVPFGLACAKSVTSSPHISTPDCNRLCALGTLGCALVYMALLAVHGIAILIVADGTQALLARHARKAADMAIPFLDLFGKSYELA